MTNVKRMICVEKKSKVFIYKRKVIGLFINTEQRIRKISIHKRKSKDLYINAEQKTF